MGMYAVHVHVCVCNTEHIVLLGFFAPQRSFNKYLSSGSSIQQKESFYHYLVAGADKALIRSEEAEEDSWEGGAKALKEASICKTQWSL